MGGGGTLKIEKPVSSVLTVKPIITEKPITVSIPKTGHLTGYFLNRKPVQYCHNRTGLVITNTKVRRAKIRRCSESVVSKHEYRAFKPRWSWLHSTG